MTARRPPAANIAALVLAAGGSSRLGEPKQLLDWGGRPLLDVVLSKVSAWPVARIVAVIGAQAEEILAQVDFGEAAVVINPEWEEGLASSLRVGLDVLSRTPEIEAALIVLADQPGVPDEVVAGLVAAYPRRTRPALVPKYRYTRGNPVLLDRTLWSRVMSLEGDHGARGLLQAHPEWVEEIRFDRQPPRDVDTADDVADLRPRR